MNWKKHLIGHLVILATGIVTLHANASTPDNELIQREIGRAHV